MEGREKGDRRRSERDGDGLNYAATEIDRPLRAFSREVIKSARNLWPRFFSLPLASTAFSPIFSLLISIDADADGERETLYNIYPPAFYTQGVPFEASQLSPELRSVVSKKCAFSDLFEISSNAMTIVALTLMTALDEISCNTQERWNTLASHCVRSGSKIIGNCDIYHGGRCNYFRSVAIRRDDISFPCQTLRLISGISFVFPSYFFSRINVARALQALFSRSNR